jgi:ribonuclease HIII
MSLKSYKIGKEEILKLKDLLFSDKTCNVMEITNESELFRLNCQGYLVIGYKSGAVAFQDGINDYILSKISEINPPIKKVEKENDLSLNMRVNPDLLEILKNKFIELNIDEIKVNTTREFSRFIYEGSQITFYKNGTIYSQKNHPKFRDIIKSILGAYYDQNKIIIGQDEVGKGEYYGPMIVVSVSLNYNQILELQLMGVKDSKELSYNQIKTLFIKIKELNPERAYVQINPKKFNDLYKEFQNEGKTLNNLLAWGHAKVLNELLQKIKNKVDPKNITVIIDEFDRIRTEDAIKKINDLNLKIVQKTKADEEFISVSTASIIAKNIQIEILEDLEKKLNKKFTNDNWVEWLRTKDNYEYLKLSFLTNRLRDLKIKIPQNIGKNYYDVLRISNKIEGIDLDFKSEMPDQIHDVSKWFVCFANTNGGKIYFGITDKEHLIIGVNDPLKIEERLIGIARNACEPPMNIEIRHLEFTSNISIIEVSIPKKYSLSKVKSSGKYYHRISSSCDEMSSYEVEEFVKKNINTGENVDPKQAKE